MFCSGLGFGPMGMPVGCYARRTNVISKILQEYKICHSGYFSFLEKPLNNKLVSKWFSGSLSERLLSCLDDGRVGLLYHLEGKN